MLIIVKALDLWQKFNHSVNNRIMSKSNKGVFYLSFSMSIKTFLNHTPNEEDVSQLLKEFTVDFLLKGYRHLVAHIKGAVIFSADTYLDTSHFTWLVMYFLRFAALLELDLELIRYVNTIFGVTYLKCQCMKITLTDFPVNAKKITNKSNFKLLYGPINFTL